MKINWFSMVAMILCAMLAGGIVGNFLNSLGADPAVMIIGCMVVGLFIGWVWPPFVTDDDS